MSHKKLFIIAGAIAAAIVGIIYFDNTRRAQAPAEENNNVPTDETSDWETYRNEEFEFEVKYPNDVLVSESDNLVFFGLDDNTPLNLSVNFAVSQEPTLASLERRKIDPKGNMQEKENIEFHGQPAVKAVERFEGPETMSAYIEAIGFLYGQAEYVIRISGTNEPSGSQREKINQILATFKFLNGPDTSGWKTYRNEEYGFEFKYPNDWTHTIDYRGFDVCLREQGKDYYRDGAERCAVGLSIRNIGSNIKTISSIKGAYRASGLTYEESIRNIAGIQATMLGGTGGLEVYFTKDQMDFNFRVVDYINYNGVMEFDSAFAGVRDALMNILSTFKFIDS